ncbi:MAG: anaerobic sulfatase maturase [Clostridium sp.]|uniref:anaerobic sulfatase maturase n=1 Tax=Clostridium sp. TaxID=1506 RepID=UPI0039EB6212
MPPASVLIKPASSGCNLQCKYCFYHSVSKSREIKNYGIMKEETLVNLVKNILEYADDYCVFAFQGGEPTLAGLEFYQKVIELQKQFNYKNLKIENTIQTNGTLIDEKWAEFFVKNDFLVGISIDGPKDINDAARVEIGGKSIFNKVLNTIQLFDNYKVQYNVLCVVTSYVARHIGQVYNFYKKLGIKFMQFIPCLDGIGEETTFYSLNNKKYSDFLKKLFDLWYEDFTKGENIDIRYFSNIIQMAAGYKAEACGMSGSCHCYFVVEADGSVYPCDFYVTDYWKLGNLNKYNFDTLIKDPKVSEFIKSSLFVDDKCKKCKFFMLCRGGCRRWREPYIDEKPSINQLCEAYKNFFEYTQDRIYNLSRILKR